MVEICCKFDDREKVSLTLKCGKMVIEPPLEVLECAADPKLPACSAEEIYALMAFVEKTSLCKGFKVVGEITTIVPVVKGTLRDLSNKVSSSETRAFFENCLLFSPGSGLYDNCRKVLLHDQQRRKRKFPYLQATTIMPELHNLWPNNNKQEKQCWKPVNSGI